jgi:hypothetical protein
MVRTLWFADVNNRGEAYTANLVGQKGGRTALKRLQPVRKQRKQTSPQGLVMVRFPKVCRGPSAWPAGREASRTWEAPSAPGGKGRACGY